MIQIESSGDVAVARMQHGKANVLDLEFLESTATLLDEVATDARAIVLTGQGSIFSAGVDLLRIIDGGPKYVREFIAALNAFCESVFSLPVPLVAAINGHAIAGGCVVACMADRRLFVRDGGRIGVPELQVGVPFPPGPLEVMRFAVPSRFFPEVVYHGRTYSGADALERGLVDELVDADALLDRAIELATELASVPTEAFRLTKAIVRAPYVGRMKTGCDALEGVIEDVWSSPETMDTIRAYVARIFKQKK